MFCFPLFHVSKRERVVRVFCALLMNVDAHQWQDHFLELDLIDRAQTFMKMRWRIHMCAPLTDMNKDLGEKPVAIMPGCFSYQ